MSDDEYVPDDVWTHTVHRKEPSGRIEIEPGDGEVFLTVKSDGDNAVIGIPPEDACKVATQLVRTANAVEAGEGPVSAYMPRRLWNALEAAATAGIHEYQGANPAWSVPHAREALVVLRAILKFEAEPTA